MAGQIAGLLTVVVVGAAAAGYGGLLIRWLRGRAGMRMPSDGFSRAWIRLVLGLGIVGHLVAVAGLAHALSVGLIRGILAVGIAVAVLPVVLHRRKGARDWESEHGQKHGQVNGQGGGESDDAASATPGETEGNDREFMSSWTGPACRIAAVVAVLSLAPAASLPPLAYDVLEYHLEAPRLFLESGTLNGDDYNFFTRLPMEAEMLYAAGHAVRWPDLEDDRAAKWIAVGWAALFAWGCGVVARRMGGGRMVRWGTVAVGAALPLAGKVSLDAFSDGATAVFTQLMTVGFLGLLGRSSKGRADWFLAGAGAGLALSCKWGVLPHMILPAAALVLGFQAFGGQGWGFGVRRVLVAGVLTLVVFSPWVLRAAVVTGNPVFPWAASIFPSPTWNPGQEEFLVATHEPLRPWQGAFWRKAWEGAGIAAPRFDLSLGTQETEDGPVPALTLILPLGVVLAGAGLVRRRGRRVFGGALALSVLAVLAWAMVNQAPDRFLLPAAGVFVAVTVAGAGAIARAMRDARSARLTGLVAGLVLAAMVLQAEARRLALFTSGGYFAALVDPSVREEARGEVLGRPIVALQNQATAAMLRDGGRLLVLYEARGLLFPLPHLINTVFDRGILLDLMEDADTPEAIDRALAEQGFTNIVINEFELDRLVRFYPPLDSDTPIPPRGSLGKTPIEPYPLMDLYRPYASDPRFAARREVLMQWHAEVLNRSRWSFAGSSGLVICLSPIPDGLR